MRFITHFVEAQLHREVYVAVLNSLLRTPGGKRTFAQRVGISPVYLSYLLALDSDDNCYATLRTPSPEVAQRIAQSIAAPPEIRDSLHTHLLLAHENRALAARTTTPEIVRDNVHEIALEIRRLWEQATFFSKANDAQRIFRATAQSATWLLQHLDPEEQCIHYLDIVSLLCDCQHVLNRHDNVLWHTKRACLLIEYLTTQIDRRWQEHLAGNHMNMLRMQAVAYTVFEDGRRALQLLAQAQAIAPQIPDEVDWYFLVLRDTINALAKLPRFAISEVEALALKARATLSRSVHQSDVFGVILAESLANAYLRHGNIKKARAVLAEQESQLPTLVRVGSLHRLIFWRACARLHAALGNLHAQAHYLKSALYIATEAGLTHQQASIERELAEEGRQLRIELHRTAT
jgi:hypothetical protein